MDLAQLQQCQGFDWDDGNARKNWEKHGVSPIECEQLFFNRPLFVAHDEAHSAVETRYFCLGKTDSLRLLFVVFTIRGKLVRVISVRDMSRKERKVYGNAEETYP